MEKFYTQVTGTTFDSHKKFVQQLIRRGATEVDSRDKSDVIIVFCTIVCHLETDITAALSNMSELSGGKPVILVVMHHNFNADFTVPDSSRLVNNSSVILVVNCLFHETTGLFECPRNENAVREVLQQMDLPKYTPEVWSFGPWSFSPPWLNNKPKKEKYSETAALRTKLNQSNEENKKSEPQELRRARLDKDELNKSQPEMKGKLVEEKNQQTEQQVQRKKTKMEAQKGENSAQTTGKATKEKFYTHVTGNTFGSDKKFVRQLMSQGGATEVDSPAKSDVIIVFCPIVSRLGTDITAALSNMSELLGCKPVILVVMHHTFNSDFTVSDSSRLVNNTSVKLVVDCLFHETKGLFECPRNKNAVREVLKEMNLLQGKANGMPLAITWPPQLSCTRCTEMEALQKNLKMLEEKVNELNEKNAKLEEELQNKNEQLQKLSGELQDRDAHFEASGQMEEEGQLGQKEEQLGLNDKPVEDSNNHPEQATTPQTPADQPDDIPTEQGGEEQSSQHEDQ